MSQLYTRYALEADQIRFSISIFIGSLGGKRCVGSALYDNCQVESISQGGGRGDRLVFGFYDEMSHKLNYGTRSDEAFKNSISERLVMEQIQQITTGLNRKKWMVIGV